MVTDLPLLVFICLADGPSPRTATGLFAPPMSPHLFRIGGAFLCRNKVRLAYREDSPFADSMNPFADLNL